MVRVLLMLLAFSAPLQAAEKIAFLGLVMLDNTPDGVANGPAAADLERIALLEAMVAERFVQEGYELMDLAPIAEDIDRVANPANCYGCDTRMAVKLGADFVLVGEVLKVTDALLAINLQLRAAADGTVVKGGGLNIRGNTDDTWRRGMRSILNNRIFREERT